MPCSFDIINESWGVVVTGSPTDILSMKNKKAKEALRQWNKDEVGNIFQRGELLQFRIEHLQTKEADCGITSEE